MSGRSTRSCLSTSIRRRPFPAILVEHGLDQRALARAARAGKQHVVGALAGRRTGLVLRSMRCFCSSTLRRSFEADAVRLPPPRASRGRPRLRQRKARRPSSRSAAEGGSRASMRSSKRIGAVDQCRERLRSVMGWRRLLYLRKIPATTLAKFMFRANSRPPWACCYSPAAPCRRPNPRTKAASAPCPKPVRPARPVRRSNRQSRPGRRPSRCRRRAGKR
jgi:hypothetical protein